MDDSRFNTGKRIPYGMMNFADIRDEDCYYVDKTQFIQEIERANKFFFFIRPRRFGKSLTLSMLKRYYDVNDAPNFEKWFGDLYIGQHPTPERNQYLVISLNFSLVTADLDTYPQSLDSVCNTAFSYFCDVYRQRLPQGAAERVNACKGCIAQLDQLCKECMTTGQNIYLFIDEYDHFTNTILANPTIEDRYRNETHGEGYLRKLFDAIKAGTETSIKRVFVTGVSPVTMDELTSGFNIGSNYSLDPRFNEMTGFTEQEVRDMLAYYSTTKHFNHTIDELIAAMKPWYDNYCFARQAYGRVTVYNSCMVLYFVDQYIANLCQLPDNMVEDNIRVDYNKLRMLIRRDKEFAHDASVIQQLVTQGFVTGELKKGFPAKLIATPDNFVSLLYYFGMITFGGTYRGKTKFVITNETVREQLFAYLLSTYRENDLTFDELTKDNMAADMAYDGKYKPYFQYIADCIKRFSSQRDKQKGEYFVHGFTLAMTSQNRFYRPVSELDNQAGYADIFLLPLTDIYKDMEHSYVVELKYVKAGTADKEVEERCREAEAQVARYADTEKVRLAARGTRLHKLVVVYRGVDMVVCKEVATGCSEL